MPAVPGRPADSRGRAASAILLALGLAVAVLAAACSGDDGPSVAPTTKPATSTTAPAGGTTSPGGGTGATRTTEAGAPALAWKSCGETFQCARLAVPLDHAQPTGPTIELALIRRPARKPAQRIGSLLVNPGGPGVSGVDFLPDYYGVLPGEIRDRFDVVSFDPRGVGASEPVDCGTDGGEVADIDGDPDTPAERAAYEQLFTEQAERCEQVVGPLLTHVGSVDAARDLDLIRAAVGDARLTYLGYSYGAELGFAYATLFPERIRALVLDGALDPALSDDDTLRSQADALEQGIDAFFAECASRSKCGLGRDPAAATRELLDRLEAGATLPAHVGDEDRTLGIGLAQYGIVAGLYDEQFGWPELELALVQARDGDGGPLLALADTVTGYLGGGHYDSLVDAYSAINCADRSERPSAADAAALAAELGPRDPFFGAWIGWGLMGCADWPLAADRYDRTSTAPGAPPILVVGATGDPVTPYDQTQALAAQLSSGVLLTREGGGHTSYGGLDDCIDRAVDAYLLDLEPPPAGTTC
jgi:pimeloyl-ACP methyl ester carboxylesterase